MRAGTVKICRDRQEPALRRGFLRLEQRAGGAAARRPARAGRHRAYRRTEKRELIGRLTVLLLHLLKWRLQPGKRTAGWEASVRVQRNRLADHLDDNPSLRPLLPAALAAAYRDAALEAVAETGLPGATFPATCPWRVEDVMDAGFWPG
jgi:hypothetical protein